MENKKNWTKGNILFVIVGIFLVLMWLVFWFLDIYNILPGCKWIGYLCATAVWLSIGLKNLKRSKVTGIISFAVAGVYALCSILELLT